MTINTGILMIFGTAFLIADTIRFAPRRTKATPTLIPMALSTDVLTASAGQNPRARTKSGLEIIIPLANSFQNLPIFIPAPSET
ncbi:hypothetical protein ES703_106712 [subsurface metagenome]